MTKPRLPRPLRKHAPLAVLTLLACALLGGAARMHAAVDPTHWRFAQEIEVAEAGLTRVALPLETLDRTEPGQRDLRLVDGAGAEVPFALLRGSQRPAAWEMPYSHEVALRGDTTVVTVEFTHPRPWEAVELLTASADFLKAVRVEASADGSGWETWAGDTPVFRRSGVEQTVIPLRPQPIQRLRLTLDDRREAPLILSGVRLRAPGRDRVTLEQLPARIEATDSFAGHTLLTVTLPAANLGLEAVALETDAPFFIRRVDATLHTVRDDEVELATVASDLLARVPPTSDGAPATEKNTLSVRHDIPGRSLVLRIHNGDSPALPVKGVAVVHRVVQAVFHAPAPGKYRFLSGNPDAPEPQYDIAARAENLYDVPLASPRRGSLQEQPGFVRADPLATVSLLGTALDPSQWSTRRAVEIASPGVQRLELDLTALSSAGTALQDLRLVRGDRQIPYVVERSGVHRQLELPFVPQPDPERPSVSRWRVTLPARAAAITGVNLQSTSPLFERRVHLYDLWTDAHGVEQRRFLADAGWRRTPSQPGPATLALTHDRPRGDTLVIETDNGGNPPLELSGVRVTYPATHLLFPVDTAETLTLLAGNPRATSPRYDLGLMAPLLVRSEHHRASLAPAVEAEAPRRVLMAQGWMLWSALAAAVVVLLLVVAKLLPKPPAG